MSVDNFFEAKGGGTPIGFFTESTSLGAGVNVQGNQVGVYGEALANSPGTRSAPSGTGICGLGDTVGVIGQSLPTLGVRSNGSVFVIPLGPSPPQTIVLPQGADTQQSPPEPPPQVPAAGIGPPAGIGVSGFGTLTGTMGTGYQFGVQGVSLFLEVDGPGTFGTGVQGISTQGVGVIGISTGDENPDASRKISPYIGVFGAAQSGDNPKNPYPISGGDFDRLMATGVVGVGANYGGVFQSNPEKDPSSGVSPTFANVQFTPCLLGDNLEEASATPYPLQLAPIAPALPLAGQPGDILIVNQAVRNRVRPGVQVWICLASPPSDNSRGSTWARVNFDYIFTTQPPQP